MNWIGKTFSPIFSAQRCRYPRCGVTSEITSPSVRSTSRSTPWVLGCCGPMLTSISSVRTSNSMMVGSWAGAVAVAMGFLARAERSSLVGKKLLQDVQFVGQGLLPEPLGIEPKAGQDAAVVDAFTRLHLLVLASAVQA